MPGNVRVAYPPLRRRSAAPTGAGNSRLSSSHGASPIDGRIVKALQGLQSGAAHATPQRETGPFQGWRKRSSIRERAQLLSHWRVRDDAAHNKQCAHTSSFYNACIVEDQYVGIAAWLAASTAIFTRVEQKLSNDLSAQLCPL